MPLMATVFALLTDPVSVASLARKVIKSCGWILIIAKCHAFKGLI